jgi:hypothetical protein
MGGRITLEYAAGGAHAARTFLRLSRSVPLIPSWEGPCADPEEKRDPAEDKDYRLGTFLGDA